MLQLDHKNLDVYKLSVNFVVDLYKVINDFPALEKYAISQQLRRAAVSIVSNIAEGSSRKSERERVRFYEIARGSLIEIDAQLEIAFRLKYVNKEDLEVLGSYTVRIFQMLTKMMH